MMQALADAFVATQAWLFDRLVQPVLFGLGLGEFVEPGFDGVEFALLGALELALAWLLLRPLEAWWPAERWRTRRALRVDIVYSLLSRLGIVPLAVFALVAPLFIAVDGWLRMHDVLPPRLADWLPGGLERQPLAMFLVYLVVLDFAEYWRHRLSHRLDWWWALHAIHHSQRRMSFWTDSRNHVADDLLAGLWFGALSLAIGVPPAQFVGLLIVLHLVENLSHANTRLSFGRIGDLLVVGPRYHRWHHALEQPPGVRFRYGCNFAILLPVWDWLFGTLYLSPALPPTGVAGEGPRERAARHRFWAQQRLGLERLARALLGRRAAPARAPARATDPRGSAGAG